MLSYVPNHSKHSKTTKWSNCDELHRFDVKTINNVELRPKPFEIQQNYKSNQITMNCIDLMSETSNNAKLQSDQITMNCIDLTSKRSIMLSYVPNHSKYSKTTKVIKIQWIASIWCQNDKNVELRPKSFETQQNYKSDQITMNCIDLT